MNFNIINILNRKTYVNIHTIDYKDHFSLVIGLCMMFMMNFLSNCVGSVCGCRVTV